MHSVRLLPLLRTLPDDEKEKGPRKSRAPMKSKRACDAPFSDFLHVNPIDVDVATRARSILTNDGQADVLDSDSIKGCNC